MTMALSSHCIHCLQTDTSPLSRNASFATGILLLPVPLQLLLLSDPCHSLCSCLDISFSVSFQCLLLLSAKVPQLCWWNKEPRVPLQVLSGGQGHLWSLEKRVVLITGALRHICSSRAETLIRFCQSQGLLAQVQWTWTASSPWTEVALCDVLWRIAKLGLCLTGSMYQALTFA